MPTLRSNLQRIAPSLPFYGGGLLLVCVLMLMVIRGQQNLLVALMVVSCFLLVLFLWSRHVALLLLQAWLYLLGDIRRIFDVLIGFPVLDLLLLVAPVIVGLITIPLFLRLRVQDALSKAMLYLTVVMTLEIFNPKQGSLAVGFAGVMFYLVPVFWFWIGRQYGSTKLVEQLIYRVLLPLAFAAALLGLFQTYIGFLPYEQAWTEAVKATGYVLTLGKESRAYGFSVSAAEFMTLLCMASATCVGAAIGGRRAWALPVPIMVTAMFLGSSRGSVFKLLFGLVVVLTLRKARALSTFDLVRLMAFLMIGISTIVAVASRFAGNTTANATQAGLVSHQLGGLAHPLDSRYSTAQVHNQIILGGLLAGVTYPIGHGLGSTTAAASKLGINAEAQNSEMDFSDMFIALGIPGGLLYLFIVFTVLRYVLDYIRFVPRHVGLPVLAMFMTILGNWLIAGQYSTSATLFFVAGCVTRERMDRENTAAAYAFVNAKPLSPTLQAA